MIVASVRAARAVPGWLLLGALSFFLLPWYFLADQSVLASLPGVFGAPETASGAVQALRHGRPWLWIGCAGLALAALGGGMPAGARQGRVLLFGAEIGRAHV